MPDQDATIRNNIKPGMSVAIVLKKDQPTGFLTYGIVEVVLTKSNTHPRGIKVRLKNGQVGRVQKLCPLVSPKLSE